MIVVLVSSELLFASWIVDAATRAGWEAVRVDDPAQLPPASSINLVLVDWAQRTPAWAGDLVQWRAESSLRKPTVLLFGPHTDLEAHADARSAGLGPMMARSKVLAELSRRLQA